MENPSNDFESHETSSGRRWWLWAVLLLAVAAGVWFFLSREQDASGGLRFQTVESETGDVVAFVRATGQLNPVRKVQVGSQISGNIAELYVDFNDPVEKGQLVALLDTATFDAALRLADEPTGNLDTRTSLEIMTLFQELNDSGLTILIVTHEPDICEFTRRILTVKDGRIASDKAVSNRMVARTELERFIQRAESEAVEIPQPELPS